MHSQPGIHEDEEIYIACISGWWQKNATLFTLITALFHHCSCKFYATIATAIINHILFNLGVSGKINVQNKGD
jgi:hypothetical protein